MKEDIEEAVEILKHIKEYMQENIDNGTHKFIYNEQGFDEKCIDVINAINEILSDYKRVLKENEELKHKYDTFVKMSSEVIKNSVPVQKVKDKIEELENNKPYLMRFDDWKNKEYTNEDIINNCIEVLQDLLEEKGE